MTRTRATALAALFGLLALPVLAQFAEGFSVWDSNNDGSIGQDEFVETFTELEVFESWDADGDGFLNEEELAVALYEGYDTDESGRIEEPEFDQIVDDFQHDGLMEM